MWEVKIISFSIFIFISFLYLQEKNRFRTLSISVQWSFIRFLIAWPLEEHSMRFCPTLTSAPDCVKELPWKPHGGPVKVNLWSEIGSEVLSKKQEPLSFCWHPVQLHQIQERVSRQPHCHLIQIHHFLRSWSESLPWRCVLGCGHFKQYWWGRKLSNTVDFF